MTITRCLPRALALTLALAATEAAALSCAQPDVARSFANADAAPETYTVLHGIVTFESPWPERDLAGAEPSESELTRLTGRLEGAGLDAEGGFGNAFAGPVLLQEVCAGPWCGAIASGDEVLAFAEIGADGTPIVRLDPCGTLTFVDPAPELLDAVGACARGDCPAAQN